MFRFNSTTTGYNYLFDKPACSGYNKRRKLPLAMPKTTTFLLAEDDSNDAFFVEQGFKKSPGAIELRTVQDGAQAMEYIQGKGNFADRQKFPLPDVVLLDIKMPRVNGFEFLHWLRNDAPSNVRLTPVVIMSSSSESSDVTRAYTLGANSYFVKPADFQAYQYRIQELGSYWSDTLRHNPAT